MADEKKGCDPNLPLRDYLIRLAIDDAARAEISRDKNEAARRKAIMDHNAANPLDPKDVDALLGTLPDPIVLQLRCNQQNT